MPSAIANDDRPDSPQPAIASPAAEPLTIESLSGTYKGAVNEKALKSLSNDMKKQGMNVPDLEEMLEKDLRRTLEQVTITIKPDGTFESRINFEQHGKVKLDGNKLIFTADSSKPLDSANGSTNTPKCSECCTFTLNISTDRKTLLLDEPQNSSVLLRGYVKQ